MGLDLEQIKEAINKPQNKGTILKAIHHESRLRFHGEAFMDQSEIGQPLTDFLDWVDSLLPKDKARVFKSLFRFPVSTVNLTTRIYQELERVFDSKDANFEYEFEDPDLQKDWADYQQYKLDEPRVWRTKGWEQMRAYINSVLVVDLPEEQTTDKPEPYFYWLDIRHVIDYHADKDGGIKWIVFNQGSDRIAVIDDEKYRAFEKNEDGSLGPLKAEAPHDLGYCPSRFFWTTRLNKNSAAVKRSPLSVQLTDLDWLLFFETSKKHLDLYAPYPIYTTYEASCDYESEHGDFCDGGFIRNQRGVYVHTSANGLSLCPVCKEKKIVGVGSLVEVPAPQHKEDPDLRNPINVVTVDKNSLDYNVAEVDRLKNNIYISAIGQGADSVQRESINEKQVDASFESREAVLNSLKGNLEEARKFVDDTICRLRYGADYLGSSISYGTEFYLYSVEDLNNQYQEAKKAGASETRLNAIEEEILDTEYKTNPSKLKRIKLLKQLEPYRHYTLDELIKLSDKNLLDQDELAIKINFTRFVDRFERENNMDIVSWGSLTTLDQKVKTIKNKFVDYVREQNREPRV